MLLHGLEALAVGTLIHGGVLLVGTNLDGVQTAVSLVGAVVSALLNAAADGAVGGAGGAFLGMLGHSLFLLDIAYLAFAKGSVRRGGFFMPQNFLFWGVPRPDAGNVMYFSFAGKVPHSA